MNELDGTAAEVFEDMVRRTRYWFESGKPIDGRGCPNLRAAESELMTGWEQLLGHKLPKSASIKARHAGTHISRRVFMRLLSHIMAVALTAGPLCI